MQKVAEKQSLEEKKKLALEYIEEEKKNEGRPFGVKIWSQNLKKDIRFFKKENALYIYAKDKVRLYDRGNNLYVGLFISNKKFRKKLSAFTVTGMYSEGKVTLPQYDYWLEELKEEIKVDEINVYVNYEDIVACLKSFEEYLKHKTFKEDVKKNKVLAKTEKWIIRTTTSIIDNKIGLEFVFC